MRSCGRRSCRCGTSSSPAFAWAMNARRPRATQSGRPAHHATIPLCRRAEAQADPAQSTLERHQVHARWRPNLPVGRFGPRRQPRDPNQRCRVLASFRNWLMGAHQFRAPVRLNARGLTKTHRSVNVYWFYYSFILNFISIFIDFSLITL